jgi:hypothetical protein
MIMPGQVQQSISFASRAAEIANLGKTILARDPEIGRPQVPPGINNGIVRLTDCRYALIDKEGETKGKPQWIATAVILLPRTHGNTKTEGMTFSRSVPLYDTPRSGGKRKSFGDHFTFVVDNLRALGVLDKMMVNEQGLLDDAKIQAAMAMLKKAAPCFHFRSWRGKQQDIEQSANGSWILTGDKNDRSWPTREAAETANPYAGKERLVNIEWLGRCDAPPEVEAAAHVVDQTGKPSGNGLAGAGQQTFNEFQGGGGGASTVNMDDYEALIELAVQETAAGEAAAERLTSAGLAAGMSQKEIQEADSWDAVVQRIRAGAPSAPTASATQTAAAEDQGEPPPVLRKVYRYRPIDPNTGKPAVNPKSKKPLKVEAKVTKVNTADRTVNLLNQDDQKTTYKDVSWDALEEMG